MLRSVYLKTVRDRWVGALVGVVALFLVAWMGIAAFAGMGDDATAFIEAMPPAYLSLTGISAEAGVVGMMLGNMFNFMGPFVIAGIGVSMAAAAIAGEEADGTMEILGTMPRSRTRLTVSKVTAAVTVVAASALTASVSYALAAVMSGEDVAGVNLAAATVHLVVVAVFFVAFAVMLGAITGNRGLASGATVGLIVVSFLVSGMAPLVPGWDWLAKWSPWYWLQGPQPMANGIDAGPLAVLLVLAVVMVAVAAWGVNRRDLSAGHGRVSMLDKLRRDPRVGRWVTRIAGSGSTRSVTAKAFSDIRPLILIGGAFVAFQSVVVGVLYNAIGADITGLVDSMPDAILAMVGFADMSTAEGFYFAEVLSIVAPLVVAVVAINAGAALAKEEKRRTVAILATAPVTRTQIAASKATTMVLGSVLVGFLVAAGLALGNAVAGLGMDWVKVAASGLMVAGLGVFIGAVALVIAAATGRSQWAVAGAGGLTALWWGINSFVPVNPDYADWARISPFYYYGHDNPLEVGADWSGLAVLMGAAAVLVACGLAAYRARDLRG
ncbi:ABC transporter permease [Demequina globuliformis]|uniref:ABC transporter permease n=1 Tax=Demequina globuliformis TaxID=676202 RepID=UPI00078238A9|nr:ABC transporter permease [Demequina globuliformis]